MNATRVVALAAVLSGLIVVGLTGVFLLLGMRTVQPLNGAYGGQAMLAFELASTPEELAVVIGTDPPSADALDVRRILDQANRLDFFYMASYAVFIALSCVGAALARKRLWLLLGALLGPLAAIYDAAENQVLLQLTQPNADLGALLPSLHLRTLGKWELLALVSALFAVGFIERENQAPNGAAAAVAGLALISGALTLVEPAKYLALLSFAIMLVWFWQLGYAATKLK